MGRLAWMRNCVDVAAPLLATARGSSVDSLTAALVAHDAQHIDAKGRCEALWSKATVGDVCRAAATQLREAAATHCGGSRNSAAVAKVLRTQVAFPVVAAASPMPVPRLAAG